MAGIFISYRRDDSAGYAGRLHESLERRVGASQVFRDVDTLEPGQDFFKAIEARLSTCKALLVVIGREWLDIRDADGSRRLDDPSDLVRVEVAAGLAQPDVLVVPVLVEGAPMPKASQLPDNLRPLTRRHAVSVRDETWDADVDRLAAVVEKVVSPQASFGGVARAPKPKTIAAVAGAVVLVAALALWMPSREGSSDEPSPPVESPPASAPSSSSSSSGSGSGSGSTAAATAAPATGGGVVGAPYTIDIPRIAEAAFGDIIYSVVSGNVSWRENENELRLRIRVTNLGRGGLNFWDDTFRLVAGGQTMSPVSGLNAIVSGNSLQYGIIAFRFPRQRRLATLQIRSIRNLAEIPLDLTPTGRPPVDEQAEIADSMSQAIRESVVKDPVLLLTWEALTVTLERASTRRFANALRLILSIRVANSGTGGFFGGHIVMRAAVGDALIVPIEWPFGGIDRQSTTVETVAFDLPTTTTEAIIKTSIDKQSSSVPVRVGR
jgi:hypothetical protein